LKPAINISPVDVHKPWLGDKDKDKEPSHSARQAVAKRRRTIHGTNFSYVGVQRYPAVGDAATKYELQAAANGGNDERFAD